MTNKTGRNDPCPCGSGKKYKQCCLNNLSNVVPFPGGGNDDKFAEYQASVERLDPAGGAPPSFMEYLGKPNPATDVINELRNRAGGLVFESEKEARAFFDREMNAMNRMPQDDFLGLTPAMMRVVLNGSFRENASLVAFNEEVSSGLLEETPTMRQCRYLFQAIDEEEKGLKATQAGNLPRKTARDFYERFVKPYDAYGFNPLGEGEVPDLERLRLYMAGSKLLKKQAGRFSLTRKGKSFAAEGKSFELFTGLFEYIAGTYNWLYPTRFPEEFGFLQRSLVFCLYLLKQKAGGFETGLDLANVYKKAFPQFVMDMDIIESHDMVSSAFRILFLENFAWPFGLVEREPDRSDILDKSIRYRRSRLFDELFLWKEGA